MSSALAPREGDLVLFCQHADVCEEYIDISAEACKDQPFHWYFIGSDDGPNIARMTPHGKVNRVINWMARCDACYRKSPELPGTVIGKEAHWIGEPPVIRND
jgi:hypothetical protein